MTTTTETLWTTLPVPALILDPENRIEDANPSAETFFNGSLRSLKGAPVWDKLMVDAPLEEAFARVRAQLSPLFINDVDAGTGERPPVLCNIQVAPMADNPAFVLLLMEPREIAGRHGRSMHSKSAAKSAIGMSEMLAHEIKNPLAGITGAAQLLSMGLSAEDQELTDLIVEETRRILKLLEQVEQFGNPQPPVYKAVNIHDVLERARRSASVGFGAHMSIQESYDPSLPSTFGDADQLLQVILNLLKNASEAADKTGTIKIRTFYDTTLRLLKDDGRGGSVPLQIEILDDGPGLPPDIEANVFEPFVSGRENGTGLGLALVSKIISDHDGWVAVESVPGRTLFRISLPVAPQSEEPA